MTGSAFGDRFLAETLHNVAPLPMLFARQSNFWLGKCPDLRSHISVEVGVERRRSR